MSATSPASVVLTNASGSGEVQLGMPPREHTLHPPKLRVGRAANGIATFDGRLAPKEAPGGDAEECIHGHHSLFRSAETDATNSDGSSNGRRRRHPSPGLAVVAPSVAYAELDGHFSPLEEGKGDGPAPSKGSSMCGGFTLRGKVPTAAATLLILTAGVLAITGSALGISIAFSIQSAQALARTNAAAAFSLCHYAITASVALPKKFAKTVQFNAATLPTPQDPFRPGFDIANETWQRLWQDMLLNNLHRSGFALNDAAIGFADYNYVACQPDHTNASLASCVFVPTPLWSEELGVIMSRRDEVRSRIDGTLLSTTIGPSELTAGELPWFVFTPRESKDDFRWSDVLLLDNASDDLMSHNMRPGPPAPLVHFSQPIFTPRGEYMATTMHSLDLRHLDEQFASILRGYSASAYLLDNHGRLIASSEGGGAMTSRGVPSDYWLTFAESNLCRVQLLSPPPADGEDAAILHCRRTAATSGDKALADLYEARRDLFNQAPLSVWRTLVNVDLPVSTFPGHAFVGEMDIGGGRHYVFVSPLHDLIGINVSDTAAAASNMNWRMVVLLRETDVTAPILKGLTVAAGVSAGVAVLATALIAVAYHYLLLRPIGAIASSLADAFNADDASEDGDDVDEADRQACAGTSQSDGPPPTDSEANSSNGSIGRGNASANSGQKKRSKAEPPRDPSLLREVATIQRAFWAMRDELRLLKAFIPEHVLRARQAKRAEAYHVPTDDMASSDDRTARPREAVDEELPFGKPAGHGPDTLPLTLRSRRPLCWRERIRESRVEARG